MIRRRGSRAFGLAVALACGAVVPAGLSATSAAADSGGGVQHQLVAQATGSALTVRLSGYAVGSGEFVAEHDGHLLHTRGRNSPMVPLLDGQRNVVGGALGQDATATSIGTSGACAGVVGRNGSVEVGPHGSCLVSGHGTITLSLGSLPQLGLGDVLKKLPRLPKLPGDAAGGSGGGAAGDLADLKLPAMGLEIEGDALTARCSATATGASGGSSALHAKLIAVVDGQRIPVAELPPGGGSVDLQQILDTLRHQLPADLANVLGPLLDALPTSLPDNPVLTLTPGEQVRDRGRLTVTALHVAVAPPSLADVRVGTVSCGPNRALSVARPAPKPTGTPHPTTSAVPTAVPAGLGSAPRDAGTTSAATAPVSEQGSLGWGAVALLGLAGLAVGGALHRVRRRAPHGGGPRAWSGSR